MIAAAFTHIRVKNLFHKILPSTSLLTLSLIIFIYTYQSQQQIRIKVNDESHKFHNLAKVSPWTG